MSDQSVGVASVLSDTEHRLYRQHLAVIAPAYSAHVSELEQWRVDQSYVDISDPALIPHPDDVTEALPRTRLEGLAQDHFRGRRLPWIELARNVFLIAPIVFTWLSLSLASAAFQQNIASYVLDPGQSPPTFQQLWERGFDIPTVDWGLISRIPLRRTASDGSEWRWFTFSFIAGADATIVALLGALIVGAQVTQRRADRHTDRFMESFDADIRAIREGLRRRHLQFQIRTEQASRQAVTESLDGFTREAANIVRTMTEGANLFRDAARARQNADRDLVEASASFVRGARDLQEFTSRIGQAYDEQTAAMRDVVTALQALITEHAEMRTSLSSLGASMGGMADGLVTAGARVGDAAAAITRSHESAVRQLEAATDAEARLAEGARKLEETTGTLRDVLVEAGAAAASSNKDILRTNEEFNAAVREMLELLSTRLESATSLNVSSVQRADAVTRELETISTSLIQSQRRLTDQSQQVLAVLQALLARAPSTIS